MKLRRLGITCILVLVTLAMAVAPVSAGKATSFTASLAITEYIYDDPPPKVVGSTTHWTILIVGDVVSLDDLRVNGVLTWNLQALCLPNPNEVITPGVCWGPAGGSKWRIDTSAPGEPPSGWEGPVSVNPCVDPSRFLKSQIYHASGNGFGIYKGLHIKFILPTIADQLVLSGEIW